MNTNKTAVGIFDLRANEYQKKFMDVGLYHDSLDLFCANLPHQNSSILELACGPGNITAYLLSKRPDFKILGTDLSPNMIALAKINNPAIDFQLMDCRSIAMLQRKYDGIMCGFCLPYLSMSECRKLIADASSILQPNGILYISTMEDKYNKSGWVRSSYGDKMYLYYHEAKVLCAFLEAADFKIILLSRQESIQQNGQKTTDLIVIAQLK